MDAFISRYDPTGVNLWTRQFGSPDNEVIQSVATGPAGRVYVVGWTSGALPSQRNLGGTDIFLRVYDGNGVDLLTLQFGSAQDDQDSMIVVDPISPIGAYVAGSVSGPMPGQPYAGKKDVFIRKYSDDAGELWTRQFGSPEVDQPFGLTLDLAGNVYIAGTTSGALLGQSQIGSTDIFIRKLDSDGEEVWILQTGTVEADSVVGIVADQEGNLYLGGSTQGALGGELHSGSWDVFLQKYNLDGELTWTRQFGSEGGDVALAVEVDPSGNVYVTGVSLGVTFLRKYSSDGAVIWSREFGPEQIGATMALVVDNAGQAYLAGWTSESLLGQVIRGGRDAFLAQLSP
ncbi:MAG: SBBP repeat-containing protein [Dehalococcoidia bacterium]